ncbi:MAG: hypothetical protein WBA66_14730 [Xanthobacteraceae bacterium]
MKLSEAQRKALLELERFTKYGGKYWWKQATMRKLESFHLTERWHPSGHVTNTPAWRITAAGRAALAQEVKHEAE